MPRRVVPPANGVAAQITDFVLVLVLVPVRALPVVRFVPVPVQVLERIRSFNTL
jgi:hypothetical protein